MGATFGPELSMAKTAVIAVGLLFATIAMLSTNARARAEAAAGQPTVEQCRQICSAALKTQLTPEEKKILGQCTATSRCSIGPPIGGGVRNPLIRLSPNP